MMTNSELSRVRRQMQRRIRVVLAQRRLDAPDTVRAPHQPADQEPGSGEPAAQD